MARVQVLVCFTILFASATLLNVVSAHLKYEPALPTIDAPKTVKDVEPYTVKVVMTFVVNLEKECPKSKNFQVFFEKLRAYAKYVCPIAIVKKGTDLKGYDSDRKAKIGSLLQAMSSFARGSIKKVLQDEKQDVLNTFNWMQSVAGKIMGGREEDESEETKELTTEQQKEIKEGILKWEQVITKCVNTMVKSSSEKKEESEESSSETRSSKSSGSSSSSFSSFQDTTGGDLGSPSESPASSPSGSSESGSSFSRLVSSSESPTSSSSGSISVKGGSGSSFEDSTGGSLDSPAESPTSGASGPSSSGEISMSGSGSQFEDTTGGSLGSPAESPETSPAASPTNSRSGSSSSESGSSSSESASAFQDTTGETTMTSPTASPARSPSGSITESGSSNSGSSSSKSSSSSKTESSSSSSTVEEVENETSTQIKTFISNLEKKCPENEEFKVFFENLKGTMQVAFPGASKPSSPKTLISGMRAAAGKLSKAMAFVTSRISSKSAEAKTSMEKYQEEVIKSLQELQDINSKIVRENHSKKQGSALTVSTTQRTEIKQTITRWEQVTTQFVETAAKSESSQSSSSSSSQQSSKKVTAN